MHKCVIFLILSAIMLIVDLLIFIKNRQIKREMQKQLTSVLDEPEIFLEFFRK